MLPTENKIDCEGDVRSRSLNEAQNLREAEPSQEAEFQSADPDDAFFADQVQQLDRPSRGEMAYVLRETVAWIMGTSRNVGQAQRGAFNRILVLGYVLGINTGPLGSIKCLSDIARLTGVSPARTSFLANNLAETFGVQFESRQTPEQRERHRLARIAVCAAKKGDSIHGKN